LVLIKTHKFETIKSCIFLAQLNDKPIAYST